MNKILLTLTIMFTLVLPTFSAHLHKEKYYQNIWCSNNKGKQEVILEDGSRVDCLTNYYAVEVEFANKQFEAVGQSLYYALMTGKQPAILLIMENPEKDTVYLKRLHKTAVKYGITVWTINKEGK